MVKNEISEGFSSSYLFLKCSVAIVNMLLPKQINLFQLPKSRRYIYFTDGNYFLKLHRNEKCF